MDFQLHLETDTVEHASPSPAVCAAPEDSIRSVLKLLRNSGSGVAVVCRDEKLLGICTERDLVRVLAAEGNLDANVSTIMIREPATLTPRDSLAKAISQMSGRGFRQLPVVDAGGRILGILSARDILHYLVEHFPKVVYTLPPAPHHRLQEREGLMGLLFRFTPPFLVLWSEDLSNSDKMYRTSKLSLAVLQSY